MGAICCFSSLPLVLAVWTFEKKFSFNKKSTVYSNSVSVFDDTKFRIASVLEDLKNQEWRWNSESPEIGSVLPFSSQPISPMPYQAGKEKGLCTFVTIHGDYFIFIDNRNYIFSTLKIPIKKVIPLHKVQNANISTCHNILYLSVWFLADYGRETHYSGKLSTSFAGNTTSKQEQTLFEDLRDR